MLNPIHVQNAIAAAGKQWTSRLSPNGSGSEISTMLESSGSISAKVFASWWYFESAFDDVCNFLKKEFDEFVVREQQLSKVRYEVASVEGDGKPRKLATMFQLIEAQKAALRIQEVCSIRPSFSPLRPLTIVAPLSTVFHRSDLAGADFQSVCGSAGGGDWPCPRHQLEFGAIHGRGGDTRRACVGHS